MIPSLDDSMSSDETVQESPDISCVHNDDSLDVEFQQAFNGLGIVDKDADQRLNSTEIIIEPNTEVNSSSKTDELMESTSNGEGK